MPQIFRGSFSSELEKIWAQIRQGAFDYFKLYKEFFMNTKPMYTTNSITVIIAEFLKRLMKADLSSFVKSKRSKKNKVITMNKVNKLPRTICVKIVGVNLIRPFNM